MSKISRFNDRVALAVTNGVSTMWCAYIFCVIALISLPSTLRSGSTNALIQWIAQTFLQLVLLSVIMVGQKVQAQMTIQLHEKVDAHSESLDSLHEKVDNAIRN